MKRIIPQKLKNTYHLGQAILANVVFGFPSRKIKVIGVTGTNGKTTVCQMISKILEEAEFKVAMATTINFKIGEKERVNKTKFTTLSSFATQKFIKDAVKEECDYLVLEISSHSLDQNRVWGINFDVAAITNVTREHLDYHKTMEEYRRAKLRLFKNAKIAVVNLDMERPEEFIRAENKIAYGYTTQSQKSKVKSQNFNSPPQADQPWAEKLKIIKAEIIELGTNYTIYNIQDTKYQLNLPGKFNVENALVAVCMGLSQGIKPETIAKALEKIKGIPGRMEYVKNNKGLNIIVDYAVTPDSLEKLYELIKITAGTKSLHRDLVPKIIAVFGACGERDRGKRPIMGEIVAKYADYIILTDEDPHNEDPDQIIGEMKSGIRNKKENENLWIIRDRREAIKKALQLARPEDFIVVTGKGAEETMAVGNKRIPWNDRKVIIEELGKL